MDNVGGTERGCDGIGVWKEMRGTWKDNNGEDCHQEAQSKISKQVWGYDFSQCEMRGWLEKVLLSSKDRDGE